MLILKLYKQGEDVCPKLLYAGMYYLIHKKSAVIRVIGIYSTTKGGSEMTKGKMGWLLLFHEVIIQVS